MKNVIFVIFASCLGQNLFAHSNFSGQWTGQGKMYNKASFTQYCSSIRISISQTDAEFYVISSSYKCGIVSANLLNNTKYPINGDVLEGARGWDGLIKGDSVQINFGVIAKQYLHLTSQGLLFRYQYATSDSCKDCGIIEGMLNK